MSRLLRAGLLTGVVDGAWAVVLTFLYQRPQAKLWQYIASTILGKSAYDGGASTVLLGIAMHFGVAFAWTAVFLFLEGRSRWMRSVLASPTGAIRLGIVYGPLVWVLMSLLIVPALLHTPLVLNGRWLIQLAGHAAFVGIPMAWAVKRSST